MSRDAKNDEKYAYGGGNDHSKLDDNALIVYTDEDNYKSNIAAALSPLLCGLSLNLSLAADVKSRKCDPEVQEELVSVVFELPDGSQGENAFKLGQTVEVLKSYVESEYGIPMADQKLFLSGSSKAMLNPLSLLDYPEIKGQSNHLASTHCVLINLSKFICVS